MRAQITGLETAQKNAKDGISLVQTAEGALTEVHDMLNRMVELADQSANGTYDNETDRDNLQKEFDQLTKEINRIADSSNFNGINLLDGSMESGATVDLGSKISGTIGGKAITAGTSINLNASWAAGDSITINGKKYTYVAQNASATAGTFTNFDSLKKAVTTLDKSVNVGGTSAAATFSKTGESLTLQIGDTSDKYNQLEVDIQDMHAKELGLDNIKISDQKSAQEAVNVIKKAINDVSSVRGTLGATQNRLDHTINNLSVMTENIQDAESTIRDTDVADEMMAYTKNNILVQSAQAMLAQVNQVPQGVLQLLQ